MTSINCFYSYNNRELPSSCFFAVCSSCPSKLDIHLEFLSVSTFLSVLLILCRVLHSQGFSAYGGL